MSEPLEIELIEMINDFFKNLTKTKRSRHRSRVKFIVLIVGLIVLGLIVYSLVALYAVPRIASKPYRTSWIGNTFSGGSKCAELYRWNVCGTGWNNLH